MSAERARIVDLSVPISEEFPSSWPTHLPFQHKTFNWFASRSVGPERLQSRRGPYATRWMAIDEHTGTHMDAPSHFIPPSDSGLEHAGPWGDVDADGIPLEQLHGPASVIDAPGGAPEPGASTRIGPDVVHDWEAEHGLLHPGDIVLLRSGWDRNYLPGGPGDAYTHDVIVTGARAGWAAPTVATIELLLDRGVRCIGTDGPTMGPAGGGQEEHVAALGRGAVFIECLAGLDQLPARGATFLFLPIKVLHATGAPGRAIGFI